jgi:hypothetical protein
MTIIRLILLAASLALFAGCSTTQDVVLVKASGAKKVSTVAQMPESGNSSQMDQNLRAALEKEGIAVKGSVPAGSQKSQDVDAVVSYVDVWRWDLAMYLRSLSVRLYDADTGDLLVMGNWSDSPMHGFRDAQVVVEGVVREMLAKLRLAAQAK